VVQGIIAEYLGGARESGVSDKTNWDWMYLSMLADEESWRFYAEDDLLESKRFDSRRGILQLFLMLQRILLGAPPIATGHPTKVADWEKENSLFAPGSFSF
jgi:hypothetical protein